MTKKAMQPTLAEGPQVPLEEEFPDHVRTVDVIGGEYVIQVSGVYKIVDKRDASEFSARPFNKGDRITLPGDGTMNVAASSGFTAVSEKQPEPKKNGPEAPPGLVPEANRIQAAESEPSLPPTATKEPETGQTITEAPSVALAKREPRPWGNRGIELRTLEEMTRFANSIYASKVWKPKDLASVGDVVIQLQFGAEIGLAPMASIQNIAIINGKPSIYGPIGLGLIQSSGMLQDYKKEPFGELKFDRTKKTVGDDSTYGCRWTFWRRGIATPYISEWTVEDDMIAGLWKRNVHATYPKDLIDYRAFWKGARFAFADVLKGVAGREFAEFEAEFTRKEINGETKSEQLAKQLTEQNEK